MLRFFVRFWKSPKQILNMSGEKQHIEYVDYTYVYCTEFIDSMCNLH